MSYSRPSVQPGRGLKRSPQLPDSSAVGVFNYTLDADVATTESLGVIQVGSGLSITSEGVLSTNGDSSFVNVSLTSIDYTAVIDDYYIGATKNGITITLPEGIVGKVFIVKNQINGSITVKGSNGELLDTAFTKSLGTNSTLTAIFDGSRWNLI